MLPLLNHSNLLIINIIQLTKVLMECPNLLFQPHFHKKLTIFSAHKFLFTRDCTQNILLVGFFPLALSLFSGQSWPMANQRSLFWVKGTIFCNESKICTYDMQPCLQFQVRSCIAFYLQTNIQSGCNNPQQKMMWYGIPILKFVSHTIFKSI